MLRCDRCGESYWPQQQWIHDKCELPSELPTVEIGSSLATNKVVHSRHGKYADSEKRKSYRREWMRRRRAS